MNINLKQYQETAVGELIATIKTLLTKEGEKKVCVFQAPTGSGKTLMTAKFIEEIIRELPETDLCFAWVSIGKGELHLQSKRSLEKVFGGELGKIAKQGPSNRRLEKYLDERWREAEFSRCISKDARTAKSYLDY